MNAPSRIESLLWMASPMLAWSQAGAGTPPSKSKPVVRARSKPTYSRVRRKAGKVIA